ncbi:hypothetical protein DIPPA_05156 [Diplonema papillatum]|nr:hypothetical protein DIPPA_05156 [Diplonema papillatum]
MRRSQSGVGLTSPNYALKRNNKSMHKHNAFQKSFNNRDSPGEVRASHRESSETARMGATQMASLVISHILAPLWSVGLGSADLELKGCLEPVDFNAENVLRFVDFLDEKMVNFTGSLPTIFYESIFPIIERQPVLTTVFVALNIARLEFLERRWKEDKTEPRKYRGLMEELATEKARRGAMKSDRNHTMWNDENTNSGRSLTRMGGEARERLGPVEEAQPLVPEFCDLRRQLLFVVLLASCFCKYNPRDDDLYDICSKLSNVLFLFDPGEQLSTLCCGEKGPVYLSKYLRFLMNTTGPLSIADPDTHVPGKVARSAVNIPQVLQDAWLLVFESLLNLAHSKNSKVGQNICAAFTVVIRHQLAQIDYLEKKIHVVEAATGPSVAAHATIEKKAPPKPKGMGTRVKDTFKSIKATGNDLLAAPAKLVEGANRQPDSDKTKPKQDLSQLREKALALRAPLPCLLSLIRILLCRIHCHGEDGPRAWGELIETVRMLQVYPHRTGILSVEVMRAASAAVQSIDCLLRHRLSLTFVGGGVPTAFKRERAILLITPTAARVKTLTKIHLSHVPWARGFGPYARNLFDDDNNQTLVDNNWTDEVLAPSGLLINIFVIIAKFEESKKLQEGSLDFGDMMDNLSQVPPSVLAQFYPEVHAMMRGPVGDVKHIMTFSEGSGKGLSVVASLYAKLKKIYSTMIDQSGHTRHESLMHLHTPSPVNPLLDIRPHLVPNVYSNDPSNGWATLLQQIVKEEVAYHKEPDYWGVSRSELEPYEIRLVLAGGSGTVHRFCNGYAKLARMNKLRRMPVFKVYPLPLGGDNLLCGWIEKQDPVYHQLIAAPLLHLSHDEALGRMTEGEFVEKIEQNKLGRVPPTLESGLLRTALDTYLVDADKSSRVYMYKCECWATKAASDTSEPTATFAWCQQIEFGPASEAGRFYASNARSPVPPSPSNGTFDSPLSNNQSIREPSLRESWVGHDGNLLGSPVTDLAKSRSYHPPIGRKSRASSLQRGRTGSEISRSDGQARVIEVGPGLHVATASLEQKLREATTLFGAERTATGARLAKWLTETFPSIGNDDAQAAVASLLDNNVIAPATPTPQKRYREGDYYRLAPPGLKNPARGESAGPTPHTRRLTHVTGPALHLEIHNIPLSGGQDYPDLRQGKDMWVHKFSIRNVGKDGDSGLYPDPTEPELQCYVLGHKTPAKAMAKPWNKTGEGQHYTILGQLTVSVVGNNEAFHLVADGTTYGPFAKITVSPWLETDTSRRGPVKSHVSFDVMAFAPLGLG